jgi:hypothetical protein
MVCLHEGATYDVVLGGLHTDASAGRDGWRFSGQPVADHGLDFSRFTANFTLGGGSATTAVLYRELKKPLCGTSAFDLSA